MEIQLPLKRSFRFQRLFPNPSWLVCTGGSSNLLWGGPNQDPQSKVEGKARIEGAKRPRIEGEARTEGEAREKTGGGVWGGGSVSPSPENF